MKKNVKRIVLVILAVFLIAGCTNQSTNKWSSSELTRDSEILNLSVAWDGSTYKNEHIGFEIVVPDDWIREQPETFQIDEVLNDEQYDIFFEGREIDLDTYVDEIIIMQAVADNSDQINDSVYMMVVPTFSDEIEAFLNYKRDLDVEEYADLDFIDVSEITSTKFGREETLSYGLELDSEGETYYQLYFAYYRNGYFVILSLVFNENSENEINEILTTVNIN